MNKERLEAKRKILEKLFALALHEDTPEEEAHAAMEKATMIMAKEKIAVAEILKASDKKEDFITKDNVPFFYCGHRTHQDWEAYLGDSISRAFDCSFIMNPMSKMGKVYGYKTDVESVLYFFAYSTHSIENLLLCRIKITQTQCNFFDGVNCFVTEKPRAS